MNSQERFELRISDLNNAAQISREWATHTVSILDTESARKILGVENIFYEQRMPKPLPSLQLHRCYFDDVTSKENFGLILAKLEDIQAILKFTEKLQINDKLLVHCNAGISRSTAVSCGILCQHGLSPEKAIETVRIIREIAYPNEYIVGLMDDALELKGTLKKAFYRAFKIHSY